MSLLGFFILLLFLSPLLFPIYFYIRKQYSRKAWDSIKQNFGFEEVSKSRLKGSWKGETFTITYKRARRTRRASIIIDLECSLENMPKGKLRAERWWDKLGKATGLAKEFQSRSDEFNKAIYVDSDANEFITLLQDIPFCQAITQLIESRLSQVEISPLRPVFGSDKEYGGKIKWNTTAYFGFWRKLTSPSYLEQILSSLIRVKERFESKENMSNPVVKSQEEHSSSPPAFISLIGYGLPVGSLLFGGILIFWGTYYPTLTFELQIKALKIAGIGLLAYVPVAYFCFRGESDSHTTFLSFLVLTIFGLPLFTMVSSVTTNGVLDSSDAIWQKAEIVDSSIEEEEYYVTVKGAHNGKEGEPELEVSEKMYNQLQNKEFVMIKMKDGFFSEPWVEDLKLSP